MEFLFEILFEFILQLFGQLIIDLIGRSLMEPFRRVGPVNPWFAAAGYALFGAFAGGLSLLLLPGRFITTHWLRVLNLLLTPIASGVFMARLGVWRKGRGQEPFRMETFIYGFLFALSMALVRFLATR